MHLPCYSCTPNKLPADVSIATDAAFLLTTTQAVLPKSAKAMSGNPGQTPTCDSWLGCFHGWNRAPVLIVL